MVMPFTKFSLICEGVVMLMWRMKCLSGSTKMCPTKENDRPSLGANMMSRHGCPTIVTVSPNAKR